MLELIKNNADFFMALVKHAPKQLSHVLDDGFNLYRLISPSEQQCPYEEYLYVFIVAGCNHVLITWLLEDFAHSKEEIAALLYYLGKKSYETLLQETWPAIP